MDDTVLKIAAAALLHDVGKIIEPELLGLPSDYEQRHAHLYLPFSKKRGEHTHKHALWTAAFIESQRNLLPPVFNPKQAEPWGEGEAFLNLAAGHHLPEDNPWRWLIAEADRLAAGWERQTGEEEGEYISPQQYRETRLAPLLARLCPDPLDDQAFQRQGADLGLPLAPLSPAGIFPRKLAELRDDSRQQYREHCRQFLAALQGLAHQKDYVALWLEHFDSLLLVFTQAVPALRAGEVEASRDVSLYDHLRATAALAPALYLYHREEGTLTPKAIRDQDAAKFLFVSGDFYGIQDFIFASGGETQRYRAKLLRGRSFAVSLLTELAADWLCQELGLPFTAVVLNAAGKFMLIAPNTAKAKEAVMAVRRQINQWLFEISYGENSFGLSYREVKPQDLLAGRFRDIWSDIGKDLEQVKLSRLEASQFGPVGDYLDRFRNDLPRPLCPLCGKRPSHPQTQQDPYVKDAGSCCQICRDHVFLGANLVKRSRLAVVTPEAEIHKETERLLRPLLGRYQVFFPEGRLSKLAQQGQLRHLWDFSLPTGEPVAVEVSRKFINGYVPVVTAADLEDDRLTELAQAGELEEGAPKTLHHLARLGLRFTDTPDKYEGLDALGVLKADVDNLGTLIQDGLPPQRFTLARLATLSRQLNFFFCFYLPELLQREYPDTYTVFAGGDDLFLIGPWDRILKLGRQLPPEFARYVGQNPVVHLSAGIILAKAPTPISQLARQAEEALEQAKGGGKNALALFGEVVTWDKVYALEAIKNQLEGWWQNGWLTMGLLYRLNELIAAAGQERILLAQGRGIHLADLACCKWRSQLAYTVSRNVARNLKDAAHQWAITEVHSQLAAWLEQYGSCLRLPLWELLYSKRVRR